MKNRIPEMILMELDALKKIFEVNDYKLIQEQINSKVIHNDCHQMEDWFYLEQIFENDKINIYFKCSNTCFTTDKRYIMITRVFDGAVNNMVNLCMFSFDDLSSQLSKIADFLLQTQVFIKAYKNLIGE